MDHKFKIHKKIVKIKLSKTFFFNLILFNFPKNFQLFQTTKFNQN